MTGRKPDNEAKAYISTVLMELSDEFQAQSDRFSDPEANSVQLAMAIASLVTHKVALKIERGEL